MEKLCADCKRSLPLNLFSKNKTKKDGLQNRCKECSHNYFKRYYSINRIEVRKTILANKKASLVAMHTKLLQYFSTHPCRDCGEDDVIVLEFDHVPERGNKHDNVSTMMKSGSSWLTLESEIAKCDVVCANCHRRRTYKRKKTYRIQSAVVT